MAVASISPALKFRFGAFEVDLRTGELRKSGMRIKLQDQPFKILAALLEARGELVTRVELKRRIWPDTEFGDFDHALNLAINKLRIALGDSADTPRFIETLPRYGYRFLGQVEALADNGRQQPLTEVATARAVPRRWSGWLAATMVIAVAVATAAWKFSSRPAIESVAVMPFATEDAELRYLGEGIAESLTEDLAHLPNLHVVSRNSAFQLRDSKMSTRELSSRLQVRGLVTGSVRRRDEGNLSVTVELLDGRTDRHIWGSEYVVRAGQLAEAQSKIVQDVFLGLRYRLDSKQTGQLGRRNTTNSEAYDAYLRGKFAIENHERQKVLEAIRWFKEAARLDPNFVLAYVGLEEAYGVAAGIGNIPPKHALPLADAAAQRALELGPEMAESHIAAAYMQLNIHRNLPAAIAEVKRAIELDPSLAKAHASYAGFLLFGGQPLQALGELRKAMSLDPEWLFPRFVYGMTLQVAGQFEESEAFGRTLPAPGGPRIVALALIRQGKYERAIGEVEDASRRGPVTDREFLLAWANAELGKPEWLRRMATNTAKVRETRYFSAADTAVLFATLRDRKNTLLMLNTALDEQDPMIYNFVAGHPGGPEFLRGDPEYEDILRKMFTPQ